MLLLVMGVLLMGQHLDLVVAYIVGLFLLLLIICFLKGGKPRWRWGKEEC